MNNDSVIFEIRLRVAVPNYGTEHEISALDWILELLRHDSEITVLDTFEQKMKLVAEGDEQ